MGAKTRRLRDRPLARRKSSTQWLRAVLALPLLALAPMATADSTLVAGTGVLRASAHVDFRIVIPPTLRMELKQLARATNPTAAGQPQLTLVAGAAEPRDLLAARVFANVGSIVVTSADHAFSDTQELRPSPGAISATVTALDTPRVLAHPQLSGSGIAAVTVAGQRRVVHEGAHWSYQMVGGHGAGSPHGHSEGLVYTVQSP